MFYSDFEIQVPDEGNIFGNPYAGAISFFPSSCDGHVCVLTSKIIVAKKHETDVYGNRIVGVGVGMSGFKQMKKDVDCYSSCNQDCYSRLKIKKVWAIKSNNGWKSEGWTNKDDPQGTGDHESYKLVQKFVSK